VSLSLYLWCVRKYEGGLYCGDKSDRAAEQLVLLFLAPFSSLILVLLLMQLLLMLLFGATNTVVTSCDSA
jgi:hypothetical protein